MIADEHRRGARRRRDAPTPIETITDADGLPLRQRHPLDPGRRRPRSAACSTARASTPPTCRPATSCPRDDRGPSSSTRPRSSTLLAGVGGEDVDRGVHGLGLVQVHVGDTTLEPDTTTTVADDASEVAVEVQNQGEADESGVRSRSPSTDEEPTETIPQIAAGRDRGRRSAARPAAPAGDRGRRSRSLVEPVAGEVDHRQQRVHATRSSSATPLGCASPTWARRGPSPRTPCASRGRRRRRRARSPRPPSTPRSSPSQAGEADRALVPFENSIEGAVRSTLDTLAFDADGRHASSASTTSPISHCLIAREEMPLERDRGRPLPPPGDRPVRPLHPRAAARGRGARGLEHRRGRAAGERERRALGRARRRLGGRALRLPRSCATASRTSPTTSPASSGSPPRGPRPSGEGPWRTTLVFSELGDDQPGALVEALQAFSERGRQPDPDRVAARAGAASAATCSSSTSRGRPTTSRVAEAIEDLRSQGRVGARPGQLPESRPESRGP